MLHLTVTAFAADRRAVYDLWVDRLHHIQDLKLHFLSHKIKADRAALAKSARSHRVEDHFDVILGRIGIDETEPRDSFDLSSRPPFCRCDQCQTLLMVLEKP